jgi:hypothetical protein
MASGKGRRQLVGFWWVLAFMLGAAAGALSSNLIGISYTAWWVVGFCGSAAVVVGIAEWFGHNHRAGSGPATMRRPFIRANLTQPSQKDPQDKAATRRGQLHAIRGRKRADPPSSGAS